MKKKIFITGISSQIIQATLAHIDFAEHEIYGLTRNPEKVSITKNVTVVKGDIMNIETFRFFLKDCNFIIHAAAVTHSLNEKDYFEVNLEATKNLIDLANKTGVSNFIYISSNTAGEHSGAYGKSKFLAENYIKNNFENWLILRPAEVYGSGKKEGIEKFVSGVINSPLALYPAGVPDKLYPVHLDDVARIFFEVIFVEKITNEQITICGPGGFSFPELFQLIKTYKRKHIYPISISKNLMFLIEKISRKIPFYMGIMPDQIPRLYSRKNCGTTLFRQGKKTFENYLKERIFSDEKV